MTDEQQIIKILTEIACKPAEGVTSDTTLTDGLGLESLDRVEAVGEIEADFGIRISDEEAGAANTVGDVVALVARKVSEA